MTQQEFYKRYSYDAKSDKLGGGGFARVFKAWDSVEDCYVALKIQPVGVNPDLRLRKEVECATELHHPNIARYKACYTFDTFDGETDIAVMSYYEHGSLDKLLCSQRLTDEEREDILTQILDGISFLHSHGIIHRDLKPQNILILYHGGRYVPKITDFGISKQLDDGVSSVVHNSVVGGTYAYASPEQLKEATIRKNTDLWSFGVIAYQMFVGVLPFNCGKFSPTSQEGHSERLRQMTSGVLPTALNNVPEPWQRLIRMCLVVDNTQRLAHVEDCMAILNNQPEDVTVDESTIVEPPVEVVAEPVKEEVKPRVDTPKQEEQPKSNIPTEPTPKNSKWWLWLLLLPLIAVGGAMGYLMLSNDTPEPTPKAVVQEELDIEESSAEEPIALAEPVPDPTFTLDKSSLTVDSSGGSYSVGYTIEHPINGAIVSVSDNQQWITNLSASGGNITFKTTDNTSTESRSGIITVDYGTKSYSITVKQAARPAPTFTLAKSSLTVDSSGMSYSVGYTIEHPIDGASVWVSDNYSWITNPSASGGKITFKTTDNTSTKSRTGTITAIYNGITRQITVTQKGADPININGHTAVDLGLSVKWATCNVGATSPEDYGNYFAWGETSPKTSYTEANSKTYDKSIGDIGGDSRYDAATANWGSGWRLPTESEFQELIDKCTWTWATSDGVIGYAVKSKKNGNSIFLPAAGRCYGDTPDDQGSLGYYWSSTPNDSYYAYGLGFIGSLYLTSWNDRYDRFHGQSVRPVAE